MNALPKCAAPRRRGRFAALLLDDPEEREHRAGMPGDVCGREFGKEAFRGVRLDDSDRSGQMLVVAGPIA